MAKFGEIRFSGTLPKASGRERKVTLTRIFVPVRFSSRSQTMVARCTKPKARN